jgi:hypothetical protein
MSSWHGTELSTGMSLPFTIFLYNFLGNLSHNLAIIGMLAFVSLSYHLGLTKEYVQFFVYNL